MKIINVFKIVFKKIRGDEVISIKLNLPMPVRNDYFDQIGVVDEIDTRGNIYVIPIAEIASSRELGSFYLFHNS